MATSPSSSTLATVLSSSQDTSRRASSMSHASDKSSRRSSAVLDREGNVMTEVGTGSQGVPIDLLQSLYLGRRNSTQSEASTSERSTPASTPALLRTRESSGSYSHRERSNERPPSSLGLRAVSQDRFEEEDEPVVVAPWPRSISFTSTLTFPPVKRLATKFKKRILVTGGAGFVGSHLVDRLMCSGHDVGHPNFELVRADVVEPFLIEVDEIYHLASPASPKAYQQNAVKTLKTNFLGSLNMLGLAKRVKAKFLLSSTSEIYGSPLEHPQSESYWGNVNCTGARSCYDEGKRVAEALTYGYSRQDGVDVRVARIFNCYGPRMNSNDGRFVSNFVTAALRGEPIVIYGDGTQTRSIMFVQDLVSGLIALMESTHSDPVNIGSEDESTVLDWALLILSTVSEMRLSGELSPLPLFEELDSAGGERQLRRSEIVFVEAVEDDPPRRRPDISLARRVLGWEPRWTLKAGLRETIRYLNAREEGEF